MAGFFGKLPTSGDFLARGLAPGQRSWLDDWLTRYLAAYAKDPESWPPGGLRGLLDAPEGPLLVVIGPSVDLPGRSFPILACIQAVEVSIESASRWTELAAVALSRAVRGDYDADTLLAALNSIPPPDPGDDPVFSPILWSDSLSGPPEIVLPLIFGEDQGPDAQP